MYVGSLGTAEGTARRNRHRRKKRAGAERKKRKAGLYAREEEEEEEEEQEPEYSCAVLRSSEAMGLHSGGRDGGRERATKVRAWAVVEGEEKNEKLRAWAVAEGEEKNEKVRAWAVAEGEEKDEKEGTWACVPAAAKAEEKDEQVGAGVGVLAAAEIEERDEEVGARACVPAAAEAEGKGEKQGAVRRGGKTGLSSTDMGGSGWQPSLRTAELFGEIGAGVKTGVTVKDWMQAEERAQGNKLAEQHVRKLRGGRPELMGEEMIEEATRGKAQEQEEAERESKEAAEHLQEVIPAAVEELHTVQLRDACCCEQRQQEEGKEIKATIEVGREERGKEGYIRCGIGKSEGLAQAVRGVGVLVLEKEKGEQTVDHQT
ncbi:unnamed protein product [Closterium sp. NIES-54]